MARLFVLILLLDLALVAVALIECLSADETAIRGLPRAAWVFTILLFPPLGAIAWLVAGRPAPEFRVVNPAVPQPVRAARVLGPDDDPDFLRSLAATIKRES